MRRLSEKRKWIYGCLALAAAYVIASIVLTACGVGTDAASGAGAGGGMRERSLPVNPGHKYVAIIQPGAYVHIGTGVSIRDLDTFGGIERGGRMRSLTAEPRSYVDGKRTWVVLDRAHGRLWNMAYEAVNGDVISYGRKPIVLIYRRR